MNNSKDSEAIKKQLASKNSKFWDTRRKIDSLRLFRLASKNVLAYQKFLKRHKIDSTQIKDCKDFAKIPAISKKNYLRYYPYPELFWSGETAKNATYTSTSGSTGESFYFPRESTLDWQSSIIHENFINGFSKKGESVLVVVTFGMGVWIGGLMTYRAFEYVRDRSNRKISIITPGINKSEIFTTLQKLSPMFDHTIICGYPPFVKDVIDEAETLKINTKKLNLKFSFAAESFTESYRDFLKEKVDLKNKYLETISIYGSADIGAMASETPLSILVRELAIKDKKFFESIFGQINKTPTLAQFNPSFINFEEVEGELLLTGNSTIPLIRYALGDNGGVFTYDQIVAKAKNFNIDLDNLVKKLGLKDTVSELPFVYVYERKDLSTTLYGLNVFPEFIKEALLQPELHKYCTGKMAMCTKFNKKQDQFLEINVELKKNVTSNQNLAKKIQKVVLSHLLKRSSEYRELYKFIKNRALPKIVLWSAENPKYFRPGIKQKWVIK